MSWSTRLEKLGFTVKEMVRCRTNSGGAVFIPARVNDKPVQMMFSNHRGYDCHLYQSYVTDHALSVDLITLSAFGRTATNPHVHVWGEYREGNPPMAGFLCAPFFQDGIVAIDASVPAMAWATARDHLSLSGAVSRLALHGARVTLDGKHFAVGYQVASSVAEQDLGNRKPGRHGRVDLSVSLPGVGTISESVVARQAKAGFAGVLGHDFWCRWVTVFDFPAGELLLFPYD